MAQAGELDSLFESGWQAEWGGAIELWDVQMKIGVAKYPPLFNQVLIFNTDEKSLHGFPEPLTCPENVSRKSLALYYYTLEQNEKSTARSTNYSRPSEGWLVPDYVDMVGQRGSKLVFQSQSKIWILR